MSKFPALLACVILLLTQAAHTAFSDSSSALQTFQGFKGRWAIQSSGKTLPIEMTYDIGSKNSIVTEQFGKELSVIYQDGQSLLMTHFCNAGNQPRLRLKGNGPPDLFEFEMFDVTNLKSLNAAHVQRIIYRVLDDRHFDLEIVWKKGNAEESEKYKLTRV
jgi:hypothetical protein